MLEKLIDAAVQGGPLAAICFYSLFVLSREVRALKDAILQLPGQIAEKLTGGVAK